MDGFVSVDGFGDRVVDGWEMRKRLHGLYPDQNRPIYDSILTDAPIPIIQFPVYSSVKTVYQTEPKKIG